MTRNRKKLKSDPSVKLGRFCELNNLQECSDLEYGMDFRKPEYRREVFKRFYEFHLENYSHPGGVYQIMPYLSYEKDWNINERLWYAFINGSTQNPCTSWVVINNFPSFEDLDIDKFEEWHRENWRKLQYDTDRRYVKGHLSEQVQNYKKLVGSQTQEEFFKSLYVSDDPFENFWPIWDKIMNEFFMFGRLSTFSYMEYLKLMGLNIDCPDLFMDDLEGSKSHRNGMCKVLGRDDLDWHKGNPDGKPHTKELVEWLEEEAELLLSECKERFKDKKFIEDVNYFTLESTLCTFKSWFRVNRRYPNVYMDMMLERINFAKGIGWDINFEVFDTIRKYFLSEKLLVELNKKDPTNEKGLVRLNREKQNHFRLTGQPTMMDSRWACFKNDFNDKYYG